MYTKVLTLIEQEVLGRTNSLLSFETHGPDRKRRVPQLLYRCMCIRCRDNVFTGPLPRNDRKDTYTDIQIDWRDLYIYN
jgi:hypothetical protein